MSSLAVEQTKLRVAKVAEAHPGVVVDWFPVTTDYGFTMYVKAALEPYQAFVSALFAAGLQPNLQRVQRMSDGVWHEVWIEVIP